MYFFNEFLWKWTIFPPNDFQETFLCEFLTNKLSAFTES